jgi:hypothetical protein
MISIICATRKRPKYLKRLCESLESTCENKESHNYLFGFDDDDIESLVEFQKEDIAKNINWKAVIFKRMGYSKMNEYLNFLSSISKADWLLVLGDDCIMKTSKWDSNILCKKDRLIINTINPNDIQYSSENFMHFAISKKWINATGRISPYQQSDTFLTYVAKQAGIWNPKCDIEIWHVEENARPSQRIDDCVTKEIVYANEIPMNEVLIDANIIKNIC